MVDAEMDANIKAMRNLVPRRQRDLHCRTVAVERFSTASDALAAIDRVMAGLCARLADKTPAKPA